MNAAEVLDALRSRWPEESYAFIPQIRAAKYNGRTADLIVFGLWESRGLDVEGVEIKVTKADYRREAKDPLKADTFARHCHRWWIAAPKGVISDDEIPGAWGLLEVSDAGRVTVKVKGERTEKPETMSTEMIREVLRRASKTSRQEIREAEARVRLEMLDEAEGREEMYRQQYEDLTEQLREFEKKVGFNPLGNWRRGLTRERVDMADAVRRVLAGDEAEKVATKAIQQAAQGLRWAAERLEHDVVPTPDG